MLVSFYYLVKAMAIIMQVYHRSRNSCDDLRMCTNTIV